MVTLPKAGQRLVPLTVFTAILIFYCFTYYSEQLFMYPSRAHSWAQADRLALALSFFDNGMNFFKPATFSQYSENGIVGVEFPVQSYIAAALGKIFGRDTISTIFRLENVVISCVGLLFLFQACFKRTKSFVFSIVTPLFVFSSPVFIYYTCNYLPDTAGASMAFIAFYFILDFLESREKADFVVAVCFLTLGALIKTSIAIYLIGFLALVGLELIKARKTGDSRKLYHFGLIGLSAIFILVANYFYIRYLNEKHQAWLFWNKPAPFESIDDFSFYIEKSLKPTLLKEYLLLPQILFWSILVCPALPLLNRVPLGKGKLLLCLIYLVGALSMFFLMGHVLPFHEYYFISIFLPLITIALLVSVIHFHALFKTKEARRSMNIALLVATMICFFFADYQANKRLGPDYNGWGVYYNTEWLSNGDELLDSIGVGKQEKIVVLNEPEPNLSLVLLDRKGYVIEPQRWGGYYFTLVEELMMEKNLKTLVIKKRYADEYLNRDSMFFRNFDHVITEGEISVYSFSGLQTK